MTKPRPRLSRRSGPAAGLLGFQHFLLWCVFVAAGTAVVLGYAILSRRYPKEMSGRANTAINLQVKGGKVHFLCTGHADINNITACIQQPLCQFPVVAQARYFVLSAEFAPPFHPVIKSALPDTVDLWRDQGEVVLALRVVV